MAERKGSPLKGAGFFVVPGVGRAPFGGPTVGLPPGPPGAHPGPVRLTGAAIDRRLAEKKRPRPMTAAEAALARAVGEEIGRRREGLGLNQTELASRVGCDRSAVSRWEAGERLPSLAHLVALGRAFGCGARALLPDEGVGC